MIRNFVTGIVMGGVVAGAGLGVISQLAPPPQGAQMAADKAAPAAVAPEVSAVAEPAAAPVPPENAAPAAVPEGGGLSPVAPVVATPPAVLPEITQPATQPSQPTVEALPALPEGATAETAPEIVAPAVEAPAASAEVAAAPPPPMSADAPAPLNNPGAGAAAPEVRAGAEAAPSPASPVALESNIDADAVPAPADLPPPPPQEAAETLLTPAPSPAEPAPPSALVLDPVPEAAMVEPEAAPSEPDLPKVLDTSTPQTLTPSVGLNKSVDGVTVGRLPSISEPLPSTDPDAAQAVSVPAPDSRPLALFAAPFSNDLGKPVFAILLVDSGAADLDRAKLAALPFPISFVIDPLDPGAAAAEAIYRAAGKEVVMLASGIPAGATAGDLEQTFQANAGVLPEAVAVMDLGAKGFQDNRPLATMVVPIIKDQGRGLVTFEAGLNAADQVARREDVPAAVIFRDLDAGGEDSPLIRRYLDRAAFKAAQDGRVVVVGTTRPETIAALMEWAVEGKGAAVALAPISAALSVK